MKPWRRAALGFAATAALLGIAAAIALHAIVDPERLKRHAREEARKAWSRELAIGDMSLHLLPLPSLHASDVTLTDLPGDKNPWHLHADTVVVGLELWPLLSGEARPRDLRIEGDIGHQRWQMKVVAELDDVSRYGQPDAVSDGTVVLDWGKTHAAVSGRIPLQPQLRGAAVTARLESQGLNDMLGFFGIERPRATARARASLEVVSAGESIELRNVDAAIGKLRVTGDARISTGGARTVIAARLQTDRLDWAQALLETGDTPIEPLPSDEMFYDRPIAWPLLSGLQGTQGTIEARLGILRLRDGLELRQAKASMAFEGDKLQMKSFTTNILGGSATGSMQFDGRKKEVRVNIAGTGLLLERWFKERRKDVPFSGGPMVINASLSASGNSMRDLARSMTGPVRIRMGPGVYASQKAGDAEAMMVTFSKKDSAGRIHFECAGAELPFVQGRATGKGILGMRSDVSRLLTSGYISLRDETVDLRGRLRPKPGMGVGFSAIAGDIRIAGNLRAMKVTLDPADSSKRALRAGAAIATLGLSLAGSALANAAREDIDPCAAVFLTSSKDRPDTGFEAPRTTPDGSPPSPEAAQRKPPK
jgi:AsmA family protein